MSAVTVSRPAAASPAAAAAPARPPLRLLLPPVTDPPAEPAQVTAARELVRVRSVLSPVTERAWPVAPVVPREPVELPDPTALCGALVLAAVEALAGTRPLTQLTRWVTPGVLEALTAAQTDLRGRRGAAPSRRTSAPVLRVPARPAAGGAARGTPAVPAPRATIRRTLVHRVSPTVAEATVVVHDGARVRAAALRVQVHRGHWRATVLQIG